MYVLQRLMWTLPTLFLLMAATFVLVQWIPGDPILEQLDPSNTELPGAKSRYTVEEYQRVAQMLNLDKPRFYFSVVPAEFNRELFTWPIPVQQFARDILAQNASWSQTDAIVNEIRSIDPGDFADPGNERVWRGVASFSFTSLGALLERTHLILNTQNLSVENRTGIADLQDLLQQITSQDKSLAYYFPKFVWHGSENQFHRWITSAFTLDLGNSVVDGLPVWSKIARAIVWTLCINFFSIITAYLVSIPLGTYSAWIGGRADSFISLVLYFLYSLPVFWLTTLLVVFFTTNEYGRWTHIFPSTGILMVSAGESVWTSVVKNMGQLVIPVIVMSTSLMAYISRQVRNSVLVEKEKSYVWHARSMGISEHRILWVHIFRNAIFPLITMIAYLVPAMIAGSLVVEVICNIPGMGRLMYDSIFNKDWNIVLAIVMLSGFLTILGIVISDILYQWADPRVKLQTDS